ncbi:MAG: hypothetical protein WBQ75_22330 [Acetobacteraceae bacterium]
MAHEVPLSDTDVARRLELAARYDALAEQHESDAEVPDEIEAELAAIEQQLDAIGAKKRVYRPEDIARAGTTISLNSDSTLRAKRGYLRPDDEVQPETASGREGDDAPDQDEGDAGQDEAGAGSAWTSGDRSLEAPEPKAPALSAALEIELEAHRTAGRNSPGSPNWHCGRCCMGWQRTPSMAATGKRSRRSWPTPCPRLRLPRHRRQPSSRAINAHHLFEDRASGSRGDRAGLGRYLTKKIDATTPSVAADVRPMCRVCSRP